MLIGVMYPVLFLDLDSPGQPELIRPQMRRALVSIWMGNHQEVQGSYTQAGNSKQILFISCPENPTGQPKMVVT